MDKFFEKSIELPLIPLRGLVIFPKMTLHFDVGREKSINALEAAMDKEQMIFLSTQTNVLADIPNKENIHLIGVVSKIKQMVKLPDGTLRVLVEGISRAKVIDLIDNKNFVEVKLEYLKSKEYSNTTKEALNRNLVKAFEEYSRLNKKISSNTILKIIDIEDVEEMSDMIASNIYMSKKEKQEVLECVDIQNRVEKLCSILLNEIEILELETNIEDKVKKNVDKVQKEYYLKEQLKIIKGELGYKDNEKDDIEEYREKINNVNLSKEAKEKALKELDRLSKTNPTSPDGGIIRNYLDLVTNLPWDKVTTDNFDLENAQMILDDRHYGLEKVKERIIEFLAVKKLKNDMYGPIICLVGPPGVGKTSIAKSVAEALERKFCRMSLGGVKDEAEIRGHRKTYIGAMPGRIISSINRSGSSNPVFLLDEIDKMASDFRGDAVAAMLEILDYEQNVSFRDNFLEVPFDLSKFLFIATANNIDAIPSPLRDRMEIIYLTGYTIEEKYNIAVEHLMPKQLEKHGLQTENCSKENKKVKFDEAAIYSIIENYTREAGVRNLERQFATVCRKLAVIFANTNRKSITIKEKDIEKYLGVKKYEKDTMAERDEVGLVKGLAWTSVGGDTLDIEVAVLNGSGRIELTGHLGEIMKESARTAVSYIRSKAKELGIEEDFHIKYDIHVHVPEGAVPKDGPSAGITIATAIISALKEVPVRRDLAMTGEITLRGRVLPIGGLKEKSIAAYRLGIRDVICPLGNKKDIEEIPKTIRDNINFIFVSHIEQVIEKSLVNDKDFKHKNKKLNEVV